MPEKAEVFRNRYDDIRKISDLANRNGAMFQLCDRVIGALEDLEERTIELHSAVDHAVQKWEECDEILRSATVRQGAHYRAKLDELKDILEDVL